jgi:autotransporter-associated beta strand protein
LLLTSSCPTSGENLPVTFHATVQTGGVTATAATGTVTFLKNGLSIGSASLVNGEAYSATIADLPLGTTTFTAEYAGDGQYGASTGGPLTQTVLAASGTTFANSMMSMTIGANAAITSVKCVPTGGEMLSGAGGFSIYHQKDNTTIPLTHMAPLSANQILLWSDNGQYHATFSITCPDRYFKIELAHISNNPQTGDIDANWPGYEVVVNFNIKPPSGYALQNLKMDYMTVFPYYAGWYHNYNFVNIHWQNVQYSQPATPCVVGTGSVTFTKTVPEPMGAVGFFLFRADAEHDDILADMWSGETCMARPNQAHLASWTKADIRAWLDRYERELSSNKTLAFVPSGTPSTSTTNQFYQVADKMYAAGFDTLLLWNCWGGSPSVDSINTQWFAGGAPGMSAFKDYCAQRGIRLNFHAMSGHLDLDDPVYGALSPNGLDPQISRWATGTLLNDIDSSSTSFNVKPDPGCQMLASPPWSGSTTIFYPPYYYWGQGLISIDNDILSAKATEVGSTTWSVAGSHFGKYGQQWGMNHKAGTRVDFLTSYYGSNTMVDSRSDLLISLAQRFAGNVLNKYNLVDAQYDGMNVNLDLGDWGYGKYSTYVQQFTDHPVTSSYGGNVSHGHFEDVFRRIQKTVKPTDGYPAYIRLNDPSFMAPNMDEMNFAMGQSARDGQKITILGGHIGSSLDMINNCGLWDQVGTNLNLWMALQPYLTTEQKNLVGSHFTSWSYELYEPSVSGSQWLLTPKSVMARPAVDEPFFNMQEFGAMSPRQFNKVGEIVSGLTNKYAAQTPEIELYVLPGMNAADSQNVSLMPANAGALIHPVGAVQPTTYDNGVINLTVSNNTSSAIAFTPGKQGTQDYWNMPVNMSSKRGISVTVTGDNSSAQLVLKIQNGGFSFDSGHASRDYVVPINFTGQRTIEIPSGEVMWHRKNPYGFWSDYSTVGSFNYSSITGCQLFFGRVPANTTASVQISAIKAMKEDQTTGLVNPVLTINGNSVSISGTVPYNHYLVYNGGSTAKVYDGNWHFLNDLPASGGTLTADNGANNTFSVAASGSPNTWLTTRMKVSGTPWVINKPATAHEWSFESNTLDSVGTAHGTAVNGPTYVSGKEADSALNFNGTNQYVTVPDAVDLRFTSTQSFTLSAWVKLNSLPNAWAGIVNKGHGAYGIWLTPDNKWAFGGATDIVSPVTATVGEWHLLTAAQDGTTGLRKLYVDGVFSVSGTAQDGTATNALWIGATSGGVPGEFLNGAVDDVRLYPAALGGSDIKLMFDGPRQATEIRNRNATGIGSTTAVLNATLAGADADYQVHACWGTVSGGTSAGQWTHTTELGTFTNAVWTNLISHTPTGLLPDTHYYFTFYATNPVGTTTIWAPQVMSFKTLRVAAVADAQSATTAEDTAQAITLTGSASGGGALTYVIRSHPAHGTLTGVPPNVTYTPWANYNGPDNFSFAVNDSLQDSADATVSLLVSPVNDAPVATAQSVFTLIDTARAITLRGTDTENDALTSVLVSPPAHGTLTGTAPNLLYTPDAGYSGLDGFTFKVNDGLLDSAAATIAIAVRATQTVTWADSAASTSWAPGTNWLGGESPVTGDDVVLFGRTAVGSFAPAANGDYVATTLNSLKLQSGVDGDVALSFAAPLQVDGGGIVNQSSAILTIPSVTMTADQSWGGTGPIVCSSVAGNAKLTAAGASLQINAASTHSGGTSVTSGNLKLGHASALGSGSLIWLAPTGVLSNTVALGAGTGIANAINVANDMSVNTSLGSLQLSGAISGAGGIHQIGSGALTLSGANSYSGGTTYAGTLIATAAGAFGTGSVTGTAVSSLNFNTPSHATFSNNITTYGNNGLPVFSNQSATSTITLSGNNTFGTVSTWAIIAGSGVSAGGVVLTGNNTFLGKALELKNVSLTVGSAAALGSSGLIKFADLYLRNGVTLANAIQDTQYGTYTNTRAMTLGVTAGNATLSGVVDLHKGASSGTVNWSLDVAAGATLTCSGVIKTSNTAVGKATLTKTGTGTVILSGANTYGCDTTVAAGTLSLTKVNSNNESSRLTIATDAFLNLRHALSETVGTFYIGDVQQPAGTYVANGTQAGTQIGSPRITGTGKLVVSSGPAPLNNYANWISGFGVGGLTGANEDFDHDGIGNAAENVLGSNPALPNTALTLVSSPGNTFKFRHSQSNTIAADVTKSYQWSTDLTEWKGGGQSNAGGTAITITEATITDNAAPDNDLIEVSITITSGPAIRVFVRLVATQVP